MKSYFRHVEAAQFEGELTPEILEWLKKDEVTATIHEGHLELNSKREAGFTYAAKGEWVIFSPDQEEDFERWTVVSDETFKRHYREQA